MPKIDRAEYMSTESKQGGGSGFAQMEPGVYELRIQAIRTEWDTKNGHTDGLAKQCVKLVYDVASGDFAEHYSDAYFMGWDGRPDPEMDYRHSCFLSWKNLAYFKGKMEALAAANPGFDPLAAFEADRWEMFVGKTFWAVIDGEVSLNDNGYDRWTLDVGAWITPEQARTGEHPEPKVTDNRKKPKGGGSAPSAYGATLNV